MSAGPARARGGGRARSRAFVEEAARGPAALVVEGEPGIGKTELWNAGVGQARARGLRVLESRPAGAETQLSFAVLRDLLGAGFADAVASLPERQRRALEVALLFEEAGEAGPDAHTIAAATLGALQSLAEDEPVLVAIDDAQWIDGASAAALGFAVRRLGESRVSFLVGRRSGEARPETQPFDEAVAGRAPRVDRARPARRHRRSASLIRDRLGVAFPQGGVRAPQRHVGRQPVLRARARPGARPPVRLARPVRRAAGAGHAATASCGSASTRSRPRCRRCWRWSRRSPTRRSRSWRRRRRAGAIDDAVHAGLLVAEGDRLRFAHPLLASAAYALARPERAPRPAPPAGRRSCATREERARHLSLAADGPSAEVAAALHDAARGRRRPRRDRHRGRARRPRRPPDAAASWPTLLALRQRDAASYQVRHGDASRARAHLEALVAREPGDPLRATALLRLARLREERPRRVARDLRAGDRRGRRRPRRRRGAPARGRDVDAERQRRGRARAGAGRGRAGRARGRRGDPGREPRDALPLRDVPGPDHAGPARARGRARARPSCARRTTTARARSSACG